VTRGLGGLLAASAIAGLTLALAFGGTGAAQSGSAAAPEVIHTVRLLADGKVGDFGGDVTAKPGQSVQFRVQVRNFEAAAGEKLAIDFERAPGRELTAAAAPPGGQARSVTVRSAGEQPIALGVLRFNCVAPPESFCPVAFQPGKARWRGSYEVPDSKAAAIFTATVVEPSEQP